MGDGSDLGRFQAFVLLSGQGAAVLAVGDLLLPAEGPAPVHVRLVVRARAHAQQVSRRLLNAPGPRQLPDAERLSEVDDVGTVGRHRNESPAEDLELRHLPGKAVLGEHLEKQPPGGDGGELEVDHVGPRSLVEDVEIEPVLMGGSGVVLRDVGPRPFFCRVTVAAGEDETGDRVEAPGAAFPGLPPAETAGDQAAVVLAGEKAHPCQVNGVSEVEQEVPTAGIRVVQVLVAVDHPHRETDILGPRHAPPGNPTQDSASGEMVQDGEAAPVRKGGEVGIRGGSLRADRFRPQLETRGRSEAVLVDLGPVQLDELVLHPEIGGRLTCPSKTEESEGRGPGGLEENQAACEQVEMVSSARGQVTGPALKPERRLRLFARIDEQLMNIQPDRRPRKPGKRSPIRK